MIALALVAVALSLTLSAAAGMGGSLILVPALALAFGAKQGVAMAALLLAVNNVGKLIAYRKSIPLRKTLGVLVATLIGTWLGASLLLAVPADLVGAAIIATMATCFVAERWGRLSKAPAAAPLMASLSGATSGFSGTSGPLKGMALRSLGLERMEFVGAASVVSLLGDTVKATTLVPAIAFSQEMWLTIALALPLTPFAVLLGRQINQRIGSRAYTWMFWTVISGYAVRLALF